MVVFIPLAAAEADMNLRSTWQFYLFILSLLFLLLNAVCAFTPLVWIAMGSPTEAYPEIFFLLYGIPLSILLGLVSGALLLLKWQKIKKGRS